MTDKENAGGQEAKTINDLEAQVKIEQANVEELTARLVDAEDEIASLQVHLDLTNQKLGERAEPFFSADLELAIIHPKVVRYRMANKEGAPTEMSHVQFERSAFPVDDDFNKSFFETDLGDPPVLKRQDDKKEIQKAHKAMVDKQEAFRKLLNLRMVVEVG